MSNSTEDYNLQASKEYLWDHFKFNADQRLRSFNFYIVFSVLAVSGIFSASAEENNGELFIIAGVFLCIATIAFAVVDTRSRFLLNLSRPGLLEYEKQFPIEMRIWNADETRKYQWLRYTFAFRIIFITEFIFGVLTIVKGFYLI